MFVVIGILTTMQNINREHYIQFIGLPSCDADTRMDWKIIWHTIICNIWLERNQIVFNSNVLHLHVKEISGSVKIRAHLVPKNIFGFHIILLTRRWKTLVVHNCDREKIKD